MSKTTIKNTNSKSLLELFAEQAVKPARGGGGKTSEGGRYNPKTRRFTLPASFTGKKADAVVDGKVLVVAANPKGKLAVHPTQHFITLPSGVVEASEPITLEKVKLPEKWQSLEGAVAYKMQ